MTIGLKTPGADADDVQTALDLKSNSASPTFTGTVVLPSTTSIGDTTAAELGYVHNVTSAIQTQLNAKAPLASPVFTGRIDLPGYALAGLPAVGAAGGLIYVTDANSGAGTIAFSNATNWIDIKTGLTVA